MAGLLCSAIVGFLCVQVPPASGDLDIKIADHGITIADTIQAKDWSLSWGRSMEWAPPGLDMSKLAKACDGDACQLYWRKCDDAVHPTKCSYAVVTGGSSAFFDVSAANAATMKQAAEAIRIVVNFAPGATVPLAKLDRDGPGDQPPVLPSSDRPL